MKKWTVTVTDLAADLDIDGFAVNLRYNGLHDWVLPDTSSRWFATKDEADAFARELCDLLIDAELTRFPALTDEEVIG